MGHPWLCGQDSFGLWDDKRRPMLFQARRRNMRGLTLHFCAFLALAFFSARALPQQITSAPSGLTATADGLTLQVIALRDDILRVRLWKGDAVPEDASWAVLPQ